jgi:hypothetical protein
VHTPVRVDAVEWSATALKGATFFSLVNHHDLCRAFTAGFFGLHDAFGQPGCC